MLLNIYVASNSQIQGLASCTGLLFDLDYLKSTELFSVDKQDCRKVLTTGQARFNPEHHVIKCVGG